MTPDNEARARELARLTVCEGEAKCNRAGVNCKCDAICREKLSAIAAALSAEYERGKTERDDLRITELATELAALRAELAKAGEAIKTVEYLANIRYFDTKSAFYCGDPATYEARKEAAIADLGRHGDVTTVIVNEGDWGMIRIAAILVRDAAAAISARLASLSRDPAVT
jgi:hypothetical protein